MRLSILCGMLQCINYMHIALNVDFLQWLPHYNNIILFWVWLGFTGIIIEINFALRMHQNRSKKM